jgi:hypothetical protein
MSIKELGGGHVHLNCDLSGCTFEGPTMRGTEDELLDFAESRGWNIDREFGLHYCPLTTMHDCAICGAPTRNSVRDASTGEVTYYCDEHWRI